MTKCDPEKVALDKLKFNLWMGYEPVHDKDGNLVEFRSTKQSDQFCCECWAGGESPLQRYKREVDPKAEI